MNSQPQRYFNQLNYQQVIPNNYQLINPQYQSQHQPQQTVLINQFGNKIAQYRSNSVQNTLNTPNVNNLNIFSPNKFNNNNVYYQNKDTFNHSLNKNIIISHN